MLFSCSNTNLLFRLAQFNRNEWHGQTDIATNTIWPYERSIVVKINYLVFKPRKFSILSDSIFIRRLFYMTHNGHVYETFGISKHFTVKLQLLLIRAEKLDNTLTAKCFIYDVVRSYFSCTVRALAQTHLLTSFGLRLGIVRLGNVCG